MVTMNVAVVGYVPCGRDHCVWDIFAEVDTVDNCRQDMALGPKRKGRGTGDLWCSNRTTVAAHRGSGVRDCSDAGFEQTARLHGELMIE